MVEPNRVPIICRNGHQQPNADSRFCIYCGTPLNAPPANHQIIQPQAVMPPPVQPNQVQPNQVQPNQIQPNQVQSNQVQPNQVQPNQIQPQQNIPNVMPLNYVQPQQNYNQPPPNYNQQNYNQPPVNYGQPQQNQGIAPNYYPQQPQNQIIIGSPNMIKAVQCQYCGGDGHRLDSSAIVCQECGWLRPLAPGYAVDHSAFQWAEDGKAMAVLRAAKPLNAAAQAISDKVGRRWIEAAFNGVLLSERQLPEVYAQAVQAARILGMSHMPDVYVSGDHMWDCYTYGTDKDSFIVMGTALATNFKGPELLFLFAREMGHCRAGHALWKTVLRFLVGEQTRKGLMANGLFSALSLTALVEGALEMPLLAWARQSEITADRAGLLAVGDEETARRVLLTWSLKSIFLYRQINIEAWLEQQAAGDDGFTKISELATSSTPYITRRLKLMEEFSKSPDLQRWSSLIKSYLPKPAPTANTPPPATGGNQLNKSNSVSQNSSKPAVSPPAADDEIKMKCTYCNANMRVPKKVLEGKDQLAIRCPNKECGKVIRIKKKVNAAPAGKVNPEQMPNQIERNSNYDE